MTDKPGFDAEQAHKYFSAHCFNRAWDLIEQSARTPEQDEQMIRLAQASLWHWTQRSDCHDKNLSIGYWQASRVYALLGEADNARKYAQLCLEKTPGDDPFSLGYAYESLARAESIAGDGEKANGHLAAAWRHAESITDEEDKQRLIDDLNAFA